MVDAVGRHGYQATTLRELATLAGVSYSTFYQHFSSKQDCFLATFDEIVAQANERALEGFEAQSPGSGFRERLRAAFEAYVEVVISEPAATNLVIVESLSLGAPGVEHRQQAAKALEHWIRKAVDEAPERGQISDLTIRAIVGGVGRVLYRCVRGEQIAQLRDHIDDLLDWGLSYPRPGGIRALPLTKGESVTLAAKAAERPDDVEVWDEHPDSIRGRSALTQRDRIIRAAAMVVAERGYGKLSIPTITSAAGVSNQTFYEYFASKEEAFLEALDVLGRRTVARIVAAVETQAASSAGLGAKEAWAGQVQAALEAGLAYLAEKPMLGRLPFIDALGAGWAALDRVDLTIDGLSAILFSNPVPAELGPPLPEIVIEAISGGIYAVIQHEIAMGRTDALPQLLPEIAIVALAPLGAV